MSTTTQPNMQGSTSPTGSTIDENIYLITPGKKRIHEGNPDIRYNNSQFVTFRKQEQRRIKGAGQVDEAGNPILDTEYNAYPEPPQGTTDKEKESKAKFDAERTKANEMYYASATITIPELVYNNDDAVVQGAITLFTDIDGKFKGNEFAQAINRGIAQKLGNRNRAVLTQVNTDANDDPIADSEGFYTPSYPYGIEGLVYDASGQVLDETQKRGLSAADRIQRSLNTSLEGGKLDETQLDAIEQMLAAMRKQLQKA